MFQSRRFIEDTTTLDSVASGRNKVMASADNNNHQSLDMEYEGSNQCSNEEKKTDHDNDCDNDSEIEPMWTYRGHISYFLDICSTHGVPHVFRAPSVFSKVFWLLAFVANLVVLLYQGNVIIEDFMGYPYSTRVDIVTDITIEFPAVTVCNVNMMKRSKLVNTRFEDLINIDDGVEGYTDDYRWWFSSWFYNGLENSTPKPGEDTGRRTRDLTIRDLAEMQKRQFEEQHQSRKRRDSDNNDNKDSLADEFDFIQSSWDFDNFYYFDYYDWSSGANNLVDEDDWQTFYERADFREFSDFRRLLNPTTEEILDYGHQPEDFILQCTFDRRACDYRNFTQFQHEVYGNCFTFNGRTINDPSNITKMTGKTGTEYGLHLTLFTEQPEYMGMLGTESGVKVVVHKSTEQPFPEGEGVTASTGQRTIISVRELNISRLGGKYGEQPCTKTGEGTNFTSNTYSYSRSSCLAQCHQRYLFDMCDCTTDFRFSNDTQCNPLNKTQEKCRQVVEYLYDTNTLECTCPIPCREISYYPSISSSLWPSQKYARHLTAKLAMVNNKTGTILNDTDLTRQNVARLIVYFEKLNYELHQQIAKYSIESLFSDLGGIMGLYLGMSFMSIGEILLLVLGIGKVYGAKKGVWRENKGHPQSDTVEGVEANKISEADHSKSAV